MGSSAPAMMVDLCGTESDDEPAGRTKSSPLLEVGQHVSLQAGVSVPSGCLLPGATTGVILQVEDDEEPYQVQAGGKTWWYKSAEVMLALDLATPNNQVKTEGGRRKKSKNDGARRKRALKAEAEASARYTGAAASAHEQCSSKLEPPQKRAKIASGGAAAAAAAAAAGPDDDDDVVMEKEVGSNALVDFPHARSNCIVQRFAVGNFANTCANCYCYVCDVPAASCDTWAQHCEATHADSHWRAEREHERQRKQAALTNGADATFTGPHVTISCDELMRQLEQVYPVEVPTPAGLVDVELRHYQRQSLAFMLDRERTFDGAAVGTQNITDPTKLLGPKAIAGYEQQYDSYRQEWRSWHSVMSKIPQIAVPVHGGILCDEVVSAKQRFQRPYAIAMHARIRLHCRSTYMSAYVVLHIYMYVYVCTLVSISLCSRVQGMGKTLVCISLILENPLPVSDQSVWKEPGQSNLLNGGPMGGRFVGSKINSALKSYPEQTRVKTTLIITKNSLLGQWKDESASDV